MLDVLRRIVQEVNSARDLGQALEIIVTRVKRAMVTDACSVYLTDLEAQVNVLMATDGLDPASVGNIHLPFSEGLIGLVTKKAEPVNLHDASAHPSYRYVPETGEQLYHGFLGVPIIQHRKVLGVLVVQKREPHRFDSDDVSSLVTLAAQLAGAITHAQVSGGLDDIVESSTAANWYLTGQAGAPGVVFGQVVVVYPPADLAAVPDRRTHSRQEDIAAFRRAVQAVLEDLRRLQISLAASLPAEDRALFDAYIMMLDSDTLVEGSVERIRAGNWAPGALRQTIEEHARVFDEMDDDYLRERASDIRDLGRRILVRLQADVRPPPEFPEKTILAGEELSAIQLAEVSAERLVGIVSSHGSGSSHVAILARALGISAVMGVTDLPVARMDGREVILDGYQGRVYISPSAAVRDEYLRIAQEEAELSRGLEDLRDLPAQTADGQRIDLHLTTGLLAEITPSLGNGADGIGLYRTEFPFMIQDGFPSEDTQCEIYRKVLESYAPRTVTLRTLDIGGDKTLPYFPIQEDNPFLGWRGMRITLDHPEIFLAQLRAMLRADVGFGNLRLLLPMINDVGQLDEALVLLHQAHDELIEEGYDVILPRTGVMIEVPSAVYQSDRLAQKVDCLSIGSNDLTQYLLAVDRNNARVADLYDSLHPAMLRAIIQVVEGAARYGTQVSVCGEMAGDPAAAILLLGMGIDSLSMSVGSLPRVKWAIRSFSSTQARQLLEEALALDDAASIRRLAHDTLERVGLGGLVRAGK